MDSIGLTFARPALLWLLLLGPAAAWISAWLWRRRARDTARWARRQLWDRLLPGAGSRRVGLSIAALALGFAALGLALAGPRWGGSRETVERHGIDVVFVLDTSLSMAARDVAPSRFVVAQALVRRLAAGMPQHRVALVEFEGEPVVLAPLTSDVAVLDLLLDSIEPSNLPRAGSNIAPALAAATALFPAGGKQHRAIVLLTDGEDHESDVTSAIERLREEGVVVNVLAIGSRSGSPLPVPGGAANELKRDRGGQVVMSRLETRNLERLAAATDGVLVEVGQASADPTPILARIARIETRSIEGLGGAETPPLHGAERFQWPLALAAALLALHLAVPPFSSRREAR
jgi:Ca-activated chloride channel family protein